MALDPGLGFSKTQSQNISLLARSDDVRRALPPQFRTMPVLVGASRKGFLRVAAGGETPPKRRREEEAEEEQVKQGGEKEESSSSCSSSGPLLLHPRDAATFASSAIAAAHGADLLRVHEVAKNREAASVGGSVRWARAGVEGAVVVD